MTTTISDIPTGLPATEPDVFREFIAKTARKRELETELLQVKDKLAGLQETLLEQFTEEGISSKRDAETKKLVYIKRQIWARAIVSRADAAAALQRVPDLKPMVELGFNVQTLSAYFRERVQARADEENPVTDLTEILPAELEGVIALTEDHALSVRS